MKENKSSLKKIQCLVFAVNHNEFKESYNFDFIEEACVDDNKVLVDIKGIMNKNECESRGYSYWSL